MKKFFSPIFFISLIFVISFSSISFMGYFLNDKLNNNINTEEKIDVGKQVKNAFIFNHKIQIEEIKKNKNEIKNKLEENITNLNFSEIAKELSNKDLILLNYYASYEINENFSNRYSLNDFMICFIGQDFFKFKKNVESWEINIHFYLTSGDDEIFIIEKLNNKNNYGNKLMLINNITNNDYINNYLHNHFFILNLKINNIKINDFNKKYYLDLTKDNNLYIEINFKNKKKLTKFLKPINENIDIFNLSYENFYSNYPKIIINDLIFLNDNIAKINLNILIPEKIKIDELLNNLTIYVDYKSYDNSNKGNKYKLNFKIDNNYYKYSNSNWYNVTLYINNFSKEEGIIYYNFSFFYDNKEIFLNEWINNFKIITPLFPPEIKNVSYSKNSYFKNSFFIDIKFNEKINYQIANNLVLYYKNNMKQECKNLTNPIYLRYKDTYRYEINFTEKEINNEDELISLTNFVIINSGYFEYNYLNNSFIKSYTKNENYLNSTGYKYFLKEINFKFSYINKLIIDVVDAKIIKKGNKYFLDVFYHANQKWTRDNIKLINKINFNYFSYSKKNNRSNKYFENLYINEIKNINYLNNNLEVIYEIQTFNDNSIYANINFNFENNIYFLPKKIYSTNFSYNSIKNIKIKKIKNDSIIFDITYNEILEIQANNLKITYKDENNNSYNSLKDENLKSNGVVSSNNNEITYEYTLTNLKNSTEYNNFNIYLLNELNSDYKYDWSYSYYLKPIFSANKKIKTKNKILIIFLSLLILILYFVTFFYFLIKYFKYKKSIL